MTKSLRKENPVLSLVNGMLIDLPAPVTINAYANCVTTSCATPSSLLLWHIVPADMATKEEFLQLKSTVQELRRTQLDILIRLEVRHKRVYISDPYDRSMAPEIIYILSLMVLRAACIHSQIHQC